MTVTWKDQNIGQATVNAAFFDSILVQRVNADNSVTNVSSDTVTGNSTLGASGAVSPQTFSFTLPDGATGAGAFQVTITTDNGQTVQEYDSNGNPAFGNNAATINFASTLAKYADLTLADLAVQSPTSPQSGDSVKVDWSDQNVGDAAVNTAFNDYVLVQRVNADNSLSVVASGFVSGDSGLAVNGSSTQNFTFALPIGSPGAGSFRVDVTTDNGQSVKEYDSQGNLAFGNNGGTISFVATQATPALTLTIDRTAIAEAAGANAATATVTRNNSLESALVVTLASSDTSAATVPTMVTIPVGQVSATFPINAVDDGLVDGAHADADRHRARLRHWYFEYNR